MPGAVIPPARGETAEQAWQRANEQRLLANAQRWADSPEGTLFTEEWNGHFTVVTREGQRLSLWLMETDAANTDWIQSALDLRDPLRLLVSYIQATFLSLLWQPDPSRVFLGGLGGGCLATALHHYLPRARLDCVEIAPPVVAAARRFFGLLPDKRLTVWTEDVQAYLDRCSGGYDLLLLDVFYDGGATPAHVTAPDFFELCRQRMAADGLLAMNLGDSAPGFGQTVATFRELFATVYACPGRGNTTVLFATDRPALSQFELVDGAIALQHRHQFRFPFVPWTGRMKRLHPPA